MSELRTTHVGLEVGENPQSPARVTLVGVEVAERTPPPQRASQVGVESGEYIERSDPGVTQQLLEVGDQQDDPERVVTQELLEVGDQQEELRRYVTQELVEVADHEIRPRTWVTQELVELAVQCPDEFVEYFPEFAIIGESALGRVTLKLQEPPLVIIAVRVDVFEVGKEGDGPIHDSGWMDWQEIYQITGLSPTTCYVFRYSWLDPCWGPVSNWLETRILDIDLRWTICEEPSATTDWSGC